MLDKLRAAGRWTAAGLLAGLCCHAAASRLAAQAPITPDRTVQPEATSAAAPAPKKEEATFWSKIPDLDPPARPGLFLLPPTGCGFYTGLDALRGAAKDKAPFYPYRGVFYDNDFRYLDKKDGKPYDALDNLKRMHLDPYCDDWILSIGGEERVQLKQENGGANGRIGAPDNNYQLLRTRAYADLWYLDNFRVYVEFLDARIYNQNLAPLAIDRDYTDLLDAFVDIKIAELNDHPAYVRIGRQELLYGSQRLISPLDWANTRRTFEGAKTFWHGEKLDVDAFWVRPVTVVPGRFDFADHSRQFMGTYLTYKPIKGQTVEGYYLYLDDDRPVSIGRLRGGRAGTDVNTFGGRYSGDKKVEGQCCGASPGDLLWDFEAAYQFGDYSARNLSAGMATGGLGWHFSGLPMQPQVWAYYDYASGTPGITGTGQVSTFNQLFPFGHYYFGFLDEVGRQNIHDLNFQAAVYPAKWITALAQAHFFRLDEPADALYGTASQIVRLSPTGSAGTVVGNEIDFILSFQLDRHSNVSFGYSKLYEGDFIRKTGPSANPELIYAQYSLRW